MHTVLTGMLGPELTYDKICWTSAAQALTGSVVGNGNRTVPAGKVQGCVFSMLHGCG